MCLSLCAPVFVHVCVVLCLFVCLRVSLSSASMCLCMGASMGARLQANLQEDVCIRRTIHHCIHLNGRGQCRWTGIQKVGGLSHTYTLKMTERQRPTPHLTPTPLSQTTRSVRLFYGFALFSFSIAGVLCIEFFCWFIFWLCV